MLRQTIPSCRLSVLLRNLVGLFWLVNLLSSSSVSAAALNPDLDPVLLFSRSNDRDDLASHTPRLKLTQDGTAFLRSLHAPFAIISAVGPTRTGKSFLLNQLVNARADSVVDSQASPAIPFSVGSGVASHTHGLWIWPQPVWRDGVATYFVDSEGLHGVESVQSAAYEVELFVHATMLSSSVIYNTWAPMDAADVRTLKGLAAFSRLFCMDVAAAVGTVDSSVQDDLDYDASAIPENLDSPDLHWVVQNFNSHALERANSTAAQFLEQLILKDAFLEDASVDLRFLRQQFKEIKLAPISRPSDNDRLMAGNGAGITWRVLKEVYRNDVIALSESIRGSLRPKRLNGVNISGAQLVEMIARWDEDVPVDIPEHTAWHRAVQSKLELETKRLLRAFEAAAARVRIDSAKSTYESHIAHIRKVADAELAKMRQSVKNLGEDSTAIMMLSYLEKELENGVARWGEKYIERAEDQARALSDAAHHDIVNFLRSFLESGTLCRDWWIANSVNRHVEHRINQYRSRIDSIRHHLPKNYDPARLHKLAVAGTGSGPSRAAEITSYRAKIMAAHARCPNFAVRVYRVVRPIYEAHQTAFNAVGAVATGALAFQQRDRLARAAVTSTTVATRAVSRAAASLVKFAFPLIGIAYALWIAVQFAILDRDVDTVRWTPAGVAEEYKDATKAVKAVAKGSGSIFAVIVGTSCVFLVLRLFRQE